MPVTVKCRIGIDEQDPEQALDALTGAVETAGVDALIVHARKAWLEGLSPRENRDIPPLDYDRVYRLKAAHPDARRSCSTAASPTSSRRRRISTRVDGVMMGRAAYQEPWRLLAVDPLLFGEPAPFASPQRGGRGAHPLYRARACARHAAPRHHAPHARPVPRRAGRARFRRHLRDRGGQSRAPAPHVPRRAGADGGHRRRRWRTSLPRSLRVRDRVGAGHDASACP